MIGKLAQGCFFSLLLMGVTLGLHSAFAQLPQEINFQVDRFTISGDMPIPAEEIRALLASQAGRDYSLDGLQNVAKSVENRIKQAGYAFYRVVIPPQSLDSHTVAFKVVAFGLGEIRVSGNEHFDSDNLKGSLPSLRAGESPNVEKLARELKVANRHPSKDVKVTFRQGDLSDKVDAVLAVSDNRPWDVALIAANTGSEQTGDGRVTFSLQHTNLWNSDHRLNASYTTSPGHAEDVSQYGLSYNAPLYGLGAWLTGYLVYSDVDTGVVADVFNVSGSGTMYGVHYLQHLPRWGRYDQWLDVGYDNRLFENDIDFEGSPIGSDVRSTPISLNYIGEYSWQQLRLGFSLQWVKNLEQGSANDNAAYAASRATADSDWTALRYGWNADYLTTDGWNFRLRVNGQQTSDPLISGEQLGLGGASSVRGYEERETGTDAGIIAKIEFAAPPWKGLTPYLFYDWGHGEQEHILDGEDKSWDLASAGVGFRWQLGESLLLSVDWAQALEDAIETRANDDRVHGSLIWRF